jgi:hypothetical protein
LAQMVMQLQHHPAIGVHETCVDAEERGAVR